MQLSELFLRKRHHRFPCTKATPSQETHFMGVLESYRFLSLKWEENQKQREETVLSLDRSPPTGTGGLELELKSV